jgi:hypothetical protein
MGTTPFQVIDQRLDQTRADVMGSIPSYGTSNIDAWSNLRSVSDGYLVEPAPGQRGLLRMACQEKGVWGLIESQPRGKGLAVPSAAAKHIAQARLDCVTENADGSVAYVSLPWSPENLKGPLAAAAILLPILAWFGSRVLLRRFERAVKETLKGDVPEPQVPLPSTGRIGSAPLTIRELRAGPASRSLDLALAFRRRKIALYLLIALVSAFLLAHAWVVGSDSSGSIKRHVGLTVVLAWPLVLTLPPLLASPRASARSFLAYALLVGGAALWLGAGLLVILAMSMVAALGASTLFIPRTRAAQTWVLLLVVLLVLGIALPLTALQSESNQKLLATFAEAAHLSANVAIGSLVLVSMLAIMTFMPFLARLAIRIVKKLRLSASLLNYAAFWLLYSLSVSLVIGARSNARLLDAALATLPVMLAVAASALWTARKQRRGARVLYLRAFDEGSKNVTLLTRLETWLSGVASVDLIAGPDLASALAEPEELLDFVGRKGGRKYIQNLAQFEVGQAESPDRLYADGSHPIHHYFCQNRVWFEVFRRLARGCGAVVMDTRGLKDDLERGVARELIEVVHRLPLRRIVLLGLDESRVRLEKLLALAWRSLPEDSPNRGESEPEIAVVMGNRADAVFVLAMQVCRMLDVASSEVENPASGRAVHATAAP